MDDCGGKPTIFGNTQIHCRFDFVCEVTSFSHHQSINPQGWSCRCCWCCLTCGFRTSYGTQSLTSNDGSGKMRDVWNKHTSLWTPRIWVKPSQSLTWNLKHCGWNQDEFETFGKTDLFYQGRTGSFQGGHGFRDTNEGVLFEHSEMIQLIEKRCCIPHFLVGGRNYWFSTYVVLFFEWGVCMVGTGNHQLHHDMPCNFPRKVGFSVCMDGSDSCLCLAFEDSETKWTSRWDNYWKTIWGYTGNVKKRMVDDAYQKRANEFCTFGDLKRLCFDVIIDKSISKVYKLAFLVFKAVAGGGGGVFIRLCMF